MTIAGLLLTGGASRRLGVAKHDVRVHGERLADRSARVLRAVCDPVVEVGPGVSGLVAVQEDAPGSGPLAALVAGVTALQGAGHAGPAVVLAVDLPFVDEPFLAWLVHHASHESVVPRVDGRAQPLCARYAPAALAATGPLVAAGERSMHALLDAVPVTYVDEPDWCEVATARTFTDVDTPADLASLADQGVTHDASLDRE